MGLGEIAVRVARGYAGLPGVAATIVAGSVGRGRADVHSDVEVDVYWTSAPTDADRAAAVAAAGGELRGLWPYDEDDEEWSDDVTIDGVAVGVSSVTTATLERILARQHTYRLVDQLRLSALLQGRPVTGGTYVSTWKARVDYSDALRADAVRHHLARVPAGRWRRVRALLDHEDRWALRLLCDETLTATLGLWWALNRTHVEHPTFEWSHTVVPTFTRAPGHALSRRSTACDAPTPHAVWTTRLLLLDTLDLVETDLPGSVAPQLRLTLSP